MSVLQFSEEFAGGGAAFFKACAKHELEGIVSKLATAPYSSGRVPLSFICVSSFCGGAKTQRKVPVF